MSNLTKNQKTDKSHRLNRKNKKWSVKVSEKECSKTVGIAETATLNIFLKLGKLKFYNYV